MLRSQAQIRRLLPVGLTLSLCVCLDGLFNSIASADAMGRPEMLAGGIAQALLTTASGLTVAIPAIVAHLYFMSRVDRLIIEIDDLGQQVVNAIASDGWRKPQKKSSRKSERKQAA